MEAGWQVGEGVAPGRRWVACVPSSPCSEGAAKTQVLSLTQLFICSLFAIKDQCLPTHEQGLHQLIFLTCIRVFWDLLAKRDTTDSVLDIFKVPVATHEAG